MYLGSVVYKYMKFIFYQMDINYCRYTLFGSFIETMSALHKLYPFLYAALLLGTISAFTYKKTWLSIKYDIGTSSSKIYLWRVLESFDNLYFIGCHTGSYLTTVLCVLFCPIFSIHRCRYHGRGLTCNGAELSGKNKREPVWLSTVNMKLVKNLRGNITSQVSK